MKTTFTLQDIWSIKKNTWLNFIKKHMSRDQIKSMEECNNNWHSLEFKENKEIDKYRIFTGNFFNNKHKIPTSNNFFYYSDGEKSAKTISLNFYKDLLFIDVLGLSDGFCEYYAKRMEECPEAGLSELMKIITQLAIVLYNLDAGNPISVGTQVAVMLNELINRREV